MVSARVHLSAHHPRHAAAVLRRRGRDPGGGDPHNRRDFPGGWPGDPRNAFRASGRTAAEQATFAHVQALLRLRAQSELRQGPLVNLHVGDQQYV